MRAVLKNQVEESTDNDPWQQTSQQISNTVKELSSYFGNYFDDDHLLWKYLTSKTFNSCILVFYLSQSLKQQIKYQVIK